MKIYFNQVPIFVASFVLIGCSGLQWPPDRQEGTKHQSPLQSINNKLPVIRRLDLPVSGVIQVKRGDTLFIIFFSIIIVLYDGLVILLTDLRAVHLLHFFASHNPISSWSLRQRDFLLLAYL